MAADAADKSQPELRIVTEVFPPFQMLNEQGRVEGTAVEKVQRALNIAGILSKIEVLPWARAYKMSQERPNTLIFSLARSLERENQYIWLHKLDSSRTWMFKLGSNKNLNITELNSVGDWLIGVERGDLAATYLYGQVDKNRLIVSTNTQDSVRMLYSGRVDMVPTNEQQLGFYCLDVGCKVSDFTPMFELNGLDPHLYLAAHPETDPGIINKITAAFKSSAEKSDANR